MRIKAYVIFYPAGFFCNTPPIVIRPGQRLCCAEGFFFVEFPQMRYRAMVIERFGESLKAREFDVELREGQMLVRVESAGVCGSDLYIWKGNDPRVPLPLIPGHEAVGRVEKIAGEKRDILGHELKEGELVVWNRGVSCKKCYFCVVKKKSALCPERRVYGISMSCKAPPYLLGTYSEAVVLLRDTEVICVGDVEPSTLVSATCSGATAGHTLELASIRPMDTVVVMGPGSLGLFCTAMAREAGAGRIVVFGTKDWKLKKALRFGADSTVNVSNTTPDERVKYIRDMTGGRGADVVIDAVGKRDSILEGMELCVRGGTYINCGVAVPLGQVPLAFYEQVALKNLRVQGVWVNDSSHLMYAVKLVESGRYPFEELVTHRFGLEEAGEALRALERRETIKAVLIPAKRGS